MSRFAAKSPSKNAPKTVPAPRASRIRLILAVLLLGGGLLFLAYRLRFASSNTKERLRLDDAVALTPPPPLAPSDLPELRRRLQRLEPVRAAARAHPNDLTAQLELAREAMRAEDSLTALEAFRVAFRLRPQTDPSLMDAAGRAQLQAGRYKEALHTYQILLNQSPDFLFGYIRLSHAQTALERFPEAAQTLERGLQALPANDLAGRLRIVTEIERNGDLARALESAQSLLKQAPDDPAAQLTTARLLYKLQRLAEARPLLEKLVAAQPKNGAAAYYLACVVDSPLATPRNPALAEHLLLQTLQWNPQDTASYARLGEMYQEQGRSRQAAYIYLRLLELDPDRASARLQLARAYNRLGDTKAGAEQEQIAQRLLARDQEEARLVTRRNQHPTDPQALLALARHYLQSSQFVKAWLELQAAYSVAPNQEAPRREFLALYQQIGVAPPMPTERARP